MRRFPAVAAPLLFVYLLFAGAATAAVSPGGIFRDAPFPETRVTDRFGPRTSARRPLAVNLEALRQVLAAAPLEGARGAGLVLWLPRPDGGFERFEVVESPILEPALGARFPEIRTYAARGIDDPHASARLDVTPAGFHAQVLTVGEAWYVDPWRKGDAETHQAYFRSQLLRAEGDEPFTCGTSGEPPETREEASGRVALERAVAPGVPAPAFSAGTSLRTFRLALAGTAEYTAAVCAPAAAAVSCGLAAMVVSMNRVDGIYEREVAVRLVLVGNNDLLVFTDPVTDGYNNSSGSTMLSQNQTKLDTVIGTANYDVGHVFSTGGGGVASLGVPCKAASKARGVTGRGNPVGDAFDVDYVAHEMGHQFGGNHTFNGTTTNCGGGNRAPSAAYEPGSGSTIMAYAGICAAENLQPNSDPYFHAKSVAEILTYVASQSCYVTTATGNAAPTVNAGAAFTVPARTPFALTGSATDPDADALTYCWEEYDLGTAAPPNDDVAAARPIFRSFNPVASPTRVFPKLSDVLAGTTTFGESMSTRARTMTFRLTARDDRAGGGGIADAATTVSVVGTAGPFQVTAPATAVTWTGSTVQTVAWDVAGTTAAPIGCANVAVELSTDGGATFPAVLLASTPNDGSASVSVPNTPTTAARIRVSCPGNVFFNVSRPNFSIVAGGAPVTVTGVVPGSGTTAGGTAIDVTGTGFVSGATVSLGGVAATGVVFNSATSLSAVTGAHVAGAVDVVVTNPDSGVGFLASGYAYVAGTTATLFYPVAPCRVVDTRQADGPLGGPILGASPAERTFTIAPGCGVPADAKVVSANVTVTGGTAAGEMRLYPADIALPVSTVISFKAGATRANNALLLLSGAGGAGRVTVRNGAPSDWHLVVDVNGYFK